MLCQGKRAASCLTFSLFVNIYLFHIKKSIIFHLLLEPDSSNFVQKNKRKVQGVPQSQTAALPRPQEEEKSDESKQAQTEQTYEKH